MVDKTVRNCKHLMTGTTNQQDVNQDRALCETDGCYRLTMPKGYKSDKVTPRYGPKCQGCNNPDADKTDAEHLKLIKEIEYSIKGIKYVDCVDCGCRKLAHKPKDAASGKGIVIEIHHVDGNHFNNRKSNLKALCDTCHYNNYTLKEGHNKSYEIRFGCSKSEMRERCKLSGIYKYNPNA